MSQNSKQETASEIADQELESVQGGLSIIFPPIPVRPRPPVLPWPLNPRPIPVRPFPRPLPDPPPFLDVRPLIK